MARVYKAYQASLDRYVAIKVLPEFLVEESGFKERFQQEAVAVARLRHPYIPAVFDYGEADGTPYIVTDYIDGGTLAEQIGHGRSAEYVLEMLGPIAAALDYAHSRGVLHRDVKPSNILLDTAGRPILTDFGLVKMMTADTKGLTESGAIVGTPDYMSPEQCSGRELTPASDLYSLGIVAYQLITGRLPFDASTPIAAMLAQVQAEPIPPRDSNPQVSDAVEAVLLKVLAKDPRERYVSCQQFLHALAGAGVVPYSLPATIAVQGGSGTTPSSRTHPTSDVATAPVSARGGPYTPPPPSGGAVPKAAPWTFPPDRAETPVPLASRAGAATSSHAASVWDVLSISCLVAAVGPAVYIAGLVLPDFGRTIGISQDRGTLAFGLLFCLPGAALLVVEVTALVGLTKTRRYGRIAAATAGYMWCLGGPWSFVFGLPLLRGLGIRRRIAWRVLLFPLWIAWPTGYAYALLLAVVGVSSLNLSFVGSGTRVCIASNAICVGPVPGFNQSGTGNISNYQLGVSDFATPDHVVANLALDASVRFEGPIGDHFPALQTDLRLGGSNEGSPRTCAIRPRSITVGGVGGTLDCATFGSNPLLGDDVGYRWASTDGSRFAFIHPTDFGYGGGRLVPALGEPGLSQLLDGFLRMLGTVTWPACTASADFRCVIVPSARS